MKFAYYPGCSLDTVAEEYNRSTRAVATRLGIELLEIPDWVCCGSSPAHVTSHILAAALPIMNCVWPEKKGLDIITLCAACYNRFKVANMEIREDKELLKKVNYALGEDYKGNIEILHLLEAFRHDGGLDKLKEMTTVDLSGLKVACYYGCLLTRVPEELRMDNLEDPTLMDEQIAAVGATVVDWPYKTECCGATHQITQRASALRLVYDILRIARDEGANCIALACPLCQASLDLLQKEIEKKEKTTFNMPIFYFTQLLGLGIGEKLENLALDKLIIDPFPLLKNVSEIL